MSDEGNDEIRVGLFHAMEFGYKECEKGNNLMMARIHFMKVLTDFILKTAKDGE